MATHQFLTRVGPNIYSFIGLRSANKIRNLCLTAQAANVDTHTKQSSESPAPTHQETDKEEVESTSSQLEAAEKEFQEQKAQLEGKLKEIDDKYKRALAETENVRRRMMKQVDEVKMFGIQSFCKDLLPVADALSLAIDSIPQEELEEGRNPPLLHLYQGLSMTDTELHKAFTKNTVEKFTPIGEKFDPNEHEAMFEQVFEGKEPGSVAVVVKTGYKLHGRVIRPATVGVAAKTP